MPGDLPVFLVGGAVRDRLLGRPVHDMDFILPGDVLKIARHLANDLGVAFYPLDAEREMARLVSIRKDGSRLVMDFTPMQGADLESDLCSRDFTINAIALDIHHPEKLVDPLGGAVDLQAKHLKLCSSASFSNDPVRLLRAVRLAVDLTLQISPEVRALMRQAVVLLPGASQERLRDELFRILAGRQPAAAFRILERLGILPAILPELSALKDLTQPAPHVLDVWNHTLDVLSKLEALLDVLRLEYNPDKAANLLLGLAVVRLGRYRKQISDHVDTLLTPERPLRPLLFFSALYHDIGKAVTRQVDDSGRVRFLKHDEIGAEMALARGKELRLSSAEINRLGLVVQNHMRPLLLAQAEGSPSHRAVFRFFRKLGVAGIDVCLLSLADNLATYGHTLTKEMWIRQLDVARTLMEAWYEKNSDRVSPPALINGHDLMTKFDLQPGPQIGRLLEAVREAQATGEINSIEEAYQWVAEALKQSREDQG